MTSLLRDLWSAQITYSLTLGDIGKYLFGSYLTIKILKGIYWNYRWQQNRAKGQRTLEERNQRWKGQEERLFKRVSPELEREIISLDVAGLRRGLFDGKFTSVILVQVFGRRCYVIGRQLNLSGDERFSEALKEAEQADKEREKAS